MLKIINQISFNCVIGGDIIAFQIADLLNKYNKLKVFHTIQTIKRDPGTYLVYYEDGKVVGCTAILKEEPTLTKNYHTSVAFAYRNKGVGTLLLKAALSETSTDYMYGTIRKDNVASIKLYKKHNFVYIKDENKDVLILGRNNDQHRAR